jgi:hypothetical protein
MLNLSDIAARLTAECGDLERVTVKTDGNDATAFLSACCMVPEAVVGDYSEQAAGTPQLSGVQTLQNVQANFSVYLAVSPGDMTTLAAQRDAVAAALTDFEATGMEFPCYFTALDRAGGNKFFDLWRLRFFTGYSNQSIYN